MGDREVFIPSGRPGARGMVGGRQAGMKAGVAENVGKSVESAMNAVWYDNAWLWRTVYMAMFGTMFALLIVVLVRQSDQYNHLDRHLKTIEGRQELILEDLAIPFEDRRDLEEGEERSGGNGRGPSIGKCVADIFNGGGHEQGWSQGHWRKWDAEMEAQKHARDQGNNGVKDLIRESTDLIIETMCEKFDDQNECIADIKDKLGLIEDNTNTVEVLGWPQFGREANGHGYAPPQVSDINRDTVVDLDTKCDMPMAAFSTHNGNPSVRGDLVYYTDTSTGTLYAYNRRTCTEVWKKVMAEVFEANVPATGADVKIVAASSVVTARQAPALYRRDNGQEVALYTVPSDRFSCVANGQPFCGGLSTYVIELDAHTGEFSRQAKVTDYAVTEEFFAHHAGAPTLVEDSLMFGTSSFGNVFTIFGIPCTHIGQVQRFDLINFTTTWKTYTLPTGTGAGGWCGASVWGRIAVDLEEGANGIVVAPTGNTHYHPADVEACFTSYPDISDPLVWSQANIDCHAVAVGLYSHPILSDALFGLDFATGAILWDFVPGGLDTFNAACPQFGPNARTGGGVGCHGFKGPDWDFGGAVAIADLGHEKRVLAGQKSAYIYALELVSGDPRWSVKTGVGALLGGAHWGGHYNPTTQMFIVNEAGDGAVDPYDQSGFTRVSSYRVLGGGPDNGGAWLCNMGSTHGIDAHTGNIVWQAYDPVGNVTSANGETDFPDFCWNADQQTQSTEVFGLAFNLSNTAGQALNASATSSLAVPCARGSLTGPANLNDPSNARNHGSIAGTDDVVAIGSLTGNVYMLDSRTGNCLHSVACSAGAIYSGVTMADNQMFVQCGYAQTGTPDLLGNTTRIFELS